jgi:hypothetical protein
MIVITAFRDGYIELIIPIWPTIATIVDALKGVERVAGIEYF